MHSEFISLLLLLMVISNLIVVLGAKGLIALRYRYLKRSNVCADVWIFTMVVVFWFSAWFGFWSITKAIWRITELVLDKG
jgi:hypothetical protein